MGSARRRRRVFVGRHSHPSTTLPSAGLLLELQPFYGAPSLPCRPQLVRLVLHTSYTRLGVSCLEFNQFTVPPVRTAAVPRSTVLPARIRTHAHITMLPYAEKGLRVPISPRRY
jgi:hypothetical protein